MPTDVRFVTAETVRRSSPSCTGGQLSPHECEKGDLTDRQCAELDRSHDGLTFRKFRASAVVPYSNPRPLHACGMFPPDAEKPAARLTAKDEHIVTH